MKKANEPMNDGLEISWTTEADGMPSISARLRIRDEKIQVRIQDESATRGSSCIRVQIPFDEWDRIVSFIAEERARR